MATTDELGDPVAGYFFTPPKGWEAEEQPGRFELSRPSANAVAMVVPHTASKPGELQPLFDEGWIEPGVELKPRGEATIGDDQAVQPLAGKVQEQEAHGLLIVRFSPHGGGVIVIGLSVGDQPRSEVENAVRETASSVRFTEPDTGAVVESWDSALRGKTLTFLHTYDSTGGGMAEKHEIHLAEDDSFEEYRESSIVIDLEDGGGASDPQRTSSEGRWRIHVAAGQAVLELQKAEATDTYALTETDGEVHLDGRRYFVT